MMVLRTGLFVMLLLGAGMVAAHLFGIPLMLTSWASSAALIAGFRNSPAARPLPVAAGHLVSGAIGSGAAMLVPHLAGHAFWIAPLAAAFAAMAMMAIRLYHPPAAANAVIPLFTAVTLPHFGAALVIGALALAAVAWLLDSRDEKGTMA
jgi:CBS-domain-containing membrane protein